MYKMGIVGGGGDRCENPLMHALVRQVVLFRRCRTGTKSRFPLRKRPCIRAFAVPCSLRFEGGHSGT